MADARETLYEKLQRIRDEVQKNNNINKMKACDIIKNKLKDVREDICKSTICGKNNIIYHFAELIPNEAFTALINSEFRYLILETIKNSLNDYSSYFALSIFRGNTTSKRIPLGEGYITLQTLLLEWTFPYSVQLSWTRLIRDPGFIDTQIYNECQICLTKKNENENFVFLIPCGHSGYCVMCIDKVEKCPRCRCTIDDYTADSNTMNTKEIDNILNGENNSFLKHVLYLYKLSVKYKDFVEEKMFGFSIIENMQNHLSLYNDMFKVAKSGGSSYKTEMYLPEKLIFTCYNSGYTPEYILIQATKKQYGEDFDVEVCGNGTLLFKVCISWYNKSQ